MDSDRAKIPEAAASRPIAVTPSATACYETGEMGGGTAVGTPAIASRRTVSTVVVLPGFTAMR